ncbi:MAG: hypothetical protein JW990_06915 [Thermoleophilia bacterium]|nr:hypothetical protein [Thermoleophilia bacterium]
MAITVEEIGCLLDGEGLKYCMDSDHIMLGMTGLHSSYVLVLETALEGRFMRIRTMRLAFCPEQHPNFVPLLRLLGEMNYELSGIKLGWDPSDGEVDATAEATVEDTQPTQSQFHALLSRFLPQLDLGYRRISQTISTGEDPGELAHEDLLALMSGAVPMPSESEDTGPWESAPEGLLALIDESEPLPPELGVELDRVLDELTSGNTDR